jgi:hypothetical protein
MSETKMTVKSANKIVSGENNLNWIEIPADARELGRNEGFLDAVSRFRPIVEALEKVSKGIELCDISVTVQIETEVDEALSLWKELQGEK